MLILAKAIKGAEFFYNADSAHKVSKKSAQTIKDALNKIKYNLKDTETWYEYNVDSYDDAYYVAEYQRFTIYKGTIKERKGY